MQVSANADLLMTRCSLQPAIRWAPPQSEPADHSSAEQHRRIRLGRRGDIRRHQLQTEIKVRKAEGETAGAVADGSRANLKIIATGPNHTPFAYELIVIRVER